MTGPSRNLLLAAVSEGDLSQLAGDLQDVSLTRGQVLFEQGHPPSYIYFPYAGTMISLVLAARDGGTTETVSVGLEGAAGLAVDVADGAVPCFARGLAQMPGSAARIPRERLSEAAAASPALARLLSRYMESLLSTALQSVACNALHPVRERLARWLLTALDRADSRAGVVSLPLTQEFLAEMLGVRRATVGEAVLAFQAEGIVQVRRGRILVEHRSRLEHAACECYGNVRQRYAQLLPGLAAQRGLPPVKGAAD